MAQQPDSPERKTPADAEAGDPKLVGRPRIEPQISHIDAIKTMAGYGLTQNMMATILGWSHDTFTRRKQEDPAIERALAEGKASASYNVSEALYNKAVGNIRVADKDGKVYKRPPETAAIRWYDISRGGYKDRVVVEGDREHPIQAEVKGMSTAEKVEDLLGVLAKYRGPNGDSGSHRGNGRSKRKAGTGTGKRSRR